MQLWPARSIRARTLAAIAIAAALGLLALVFEKAWLGVAALVAGAAYWWLATMRYRRRRLLCASALPDSWQRALERVPFYRGLDDDQRKHFEQDVRIFIAEQTITGLQGADVNDEVKVLIASSAAMLTHGLPDFEWPRVRDIVVYPRAFDAEYNSEGEQHIAGMVHLHGPVLFSKSDLVHGFQHRDGHNVGLHELAHVMDMLDGAADGIPGDLPWVATAPWIGVMGDRLRKLRARHYRHVLRDYAATNEAEFFAVAVEAFFEQPHKLRNKDPELYEMLRKYFNQAPS